jgi:hypothetical protein
MQRGSARIEFDHSQHGRIGQAEVIHQFGAGGLG